MLHFYSAVGVNGSKIEYSLQIKVFKFSALKSKSTFIFEMRETAIDIFSGGVAGMVSTAMGHPFDTLKI